MSYSIPFLIGYLDQCICITFTRPDAHSSRKVRATASSVNPSIVRQIVKRYGGRVKLSGKHTYAMAFCVSSVYKIAEDGIANGSILSDTYHKILMIKELSISSQRKEQLENIIKDIRSVYLFLGHRAISQIADPEYKLGFEKASLRFKERRQFPIDPSILTKRSIDEVRKENERVRLDRQQTMIQKRTDKKEQRELVQEQRRIEIDRHKAERYAASLERIRLKKTIVLEKTQERIKRQEWRQGLIAEGKSFCGICKQVLPLDCFHKQKNTITGYKLYCERCSYDRYVVPNKEALNRRVKEWQSKNPDKVRETHRTMRTKPHVRLRCSLKKRIKKYLSSQSLHYRDCIGCSPKELQAHLESQFQPNMSWENYGDWHIDHIVPCAAFDVGKLDHIKWCWNYRNLRPLWGKENEDKSDTLPNGSSARIMKRDNESGLHEIVGVELERLGITTKELFLRSFDDLSSVMVAIL